MTGDKTVVVTLEAAFTIGGAVYTDIADPLATGLAGIKITVQGQGMTYSTATAGSQGLWQIHDLAEGSYTVTPSLAGKVFDQIADGQRKGNASATILVNADHIAANQSIQFLAEEEPADYLNITKMMVKGNPKKASADSIQIIGSSFEALAGDFAPENDIRLVMGNAADSCIWESTFRVSVGRFKNGKFTCQAREEGAVVSVQLDVNQNTFSVSGKNVDLGGLEAPVKIQIQVGDYAGYGTAYDGGPLGAGEEVDVINGKEPMPISLLAEKKDCLRVDHYQFQQGIKPHTDSLLIQGALVLADSSVDLAGQEMLISWGNYDLTLPAGNLRHSGSSSIYKYQDNSVPKVSALFNQDKGIFKILIKKAAIGVQSYPLVFRLRFGNFNQEVSIPN